MSKISLIALDMDGTLLNSALKISKANQQSIRDAIACGTEIVISTGRAYQGIPVGIYENTIPLNIFLPIAEKLSKYDILLHVFADGQCFNQSSQTSVIEKLPCSEIFKQFLHNAGIGIAMNNTDSKVKGAADFVSLSNNEDGVAYAIKHFLTNH